MAGVSEVAAAGVGGGLILGLAFAIGVVVIASGKGAIAVHHLANAAEVIAVVVIAGPSAAGFPLFSLTEVLSVDVGSGGASGVAAEVVDTCVEVVVVRGLGDTGFLDLLAALAEGVIAVFRTLHRAAAPGDFNEPGLAVPGIATDAVAEQVAVIVVGRSRCRGGCEVERVGVVGNVVGTVLGLDVELVRTGGEVLIGLEAVPVQHPGVLPHAGNAGLHFNRRRFVGLAADDDLLHPAGATNAGELVEGVVPGGGHGRAGPGGLYLLGGDVASEIVQIMVAGVCNAGAGKRRVD